MEEHAQPEREVHLELTEENRASVKFNQLQGNRGKRGNKGSKKKKKMSSSQMKPFQYGRSTMQARDL